jgi:tetratricopeptide (TPR) repeat protein
VNLSAAIEKYQQAIALEPDNAVWHWKLFAAFRRVGDYKAQVDSLLTAEKLEPGESRYSQQLAVARTHLAQAGDVTQWPLALEAAKRCLGLDVSIVDCEHHAALAEGATANVDSALIRHRKTLALEPANARYHLAYVSLLVEQQRNTEARQAIAVARRDAQRVQKFQAPLFTLEMLSHQLALRMRDTKEVLNSLEQADRLGGDSHPEVAFALGIAYADASPAQTDKARLLLKTFVKRVCHGAKRPQFEAECSAAEHRIERLAGQVP